MKRTNSLLSFTSCIGLFVLIALYSCKQSSPASNAKKTTETRINNPSFDFGNSQGPMPPQISYFVRNILEDNKGNLWFGTNQFGIVRYDGTSLDYFSTPEGFAGYQVTASMEDSNGDLWFTTNNGVSVYNGTDFKNYSIEDGLPNAWAWSILEDSKGVIWVGTLAGLSKFNGTTFETVQLPSSKLPNPTSILDTSRISHIFEDANSNLWFATDGTGVYKYDGNTFTNFTTQNGLCGNNITTIIQDSTGNLWFGTMFEGLCSFDGTDFSTINVAGGTIGNNEIIEIYEDTAANIWFSSEHFGVYLMDDKQLTNIYKDQGLHISAVQSIFEDSKGNFWIGGSGGLYKRDGDRFVNMTKLDLEN